MRKILIIPVLLAVFSAVSHAEGPPRRAPSGGALALGEVTALIREIETQHLGETSYAKAVMRVKTEHWARSLTMEMWGEGREKFLVRILKPKKEKGVSSLKIGDDLWNFLPKIDRLIKVPSSLMGDSWMGSHFSNDDVVKEYKIDELYDLKFSTRTEKEAVIVGVPFENAAVVWGRLEYTVDMIKRVPTSVRYYDEDGELVRIMGFDQVKKLGERWVPMRLSLKPVDEDEFTEFIYEELVFDLPLKKGLFSLRSLRRRR